MDWGGHVHPSFLKIIFLIGLNSMKKGWGGSFLASQGSVLVSLRLQFSDQLWSFVPWVPEPQKKRKED